jgi:hypothetical protein
VEDPLIFKVLSTGSFIVCSIFIPMFIPEGWRRSFYGQSVLVLAMGIWLLTLASVLRQWLGMDYPGRQPIRITGQMFVFIAMFERTAELAVVKWHRRQQRRTP